jgi:orotate phosphoribosyltransferase-like protein
MTTNKDAIARVYTLEKKGRELKEKGLGESQVRKQLDIYHNIWYVVSYTTKNDDLNKVMTRLFN